MGLRRKARERALQLLYEIDLCQKTPDAVLDDSNFLSKLEEASGGEKGELLSPQELEKFCRELVEGVTRNVREIDRLIESHSTHWKISRMALVDRNILRMAVFELLYCTDIPSSVSINEAIEIGKHFGTEESGSFINGVLDHIAKDLKKV
jgi:N utilization substance protein B